MYALDSRNSEHFYDILEQYGIDMVLVDDTKIQPGLKHDYILDHNLVTSAGMQKIWNKEFLTLYETNTTTKNDEIWSPTEPDFVNAETVRVRRDQVFRERGDYVTVILKKRNIHSHFPN